MSSQKMPPREEDQSIRDRKRQLYGGDEEALAPSELGGRKTFADYVHETPAAPLSNGVKAILWVTGVIVVLLLAVALLRAG